ncbi:winged helix DNA-binding domain-containing protein [Propioniciclava flava]|nr:winged helix DNA-binding domain-containing protein [Propioniciclava flava]
MDRRELWATRLVLQQLVGDPAEDPVSAVASSLAVQSQDVPLAHDSLAQRTGGTAAQAADALNAGHIIRTHVLRPTWHHVAAADARWLLALTSPKVLSGMRARHRQLGLDEPGTLAAELDVLLAEVAAGPRTRADLGVVFARRWERQDALFWQRLSHLCMIAELEAQICSGPVDPAGLNGHTYVLAETRLPATPPRPRDEAIADVVERFFASHGPVAVRDLQRWTRLTLGEIRGAIATLGPRLDSVKVADQTLWFGADAMAARGPGSAGFAAARRRAEGAWLLSTFDEAPLTHTTLPLPLVPGGVASAAKYGESGGGPMVWDLHVAGAWKRTLAKGRFTVRLIAAGPLPDAAKAALVDQAQALAYRAGFADADMVIT